MYTSKTTAAAALVMSALVSSSANASSVTLDAVGISPFENAQGKRAWVIQTSFDLGAESVLLRDVGMYRLEATREDGSVQRLRAVGLQPLEDIQFPMVFNLDAVNYGQNVIDDLNALSENAWGLVVNETSAAAFQLAAWEIANETGDYDLDDGNFQVTGDSAASNRAEDTATGWLESISTGVWQPPTDEFDIVSSGDGADLLTSGDDLQITPIPLPASAALLLLSAAGLGGMSHANRKRRK